MTAHSVWTQTMCVSRWSTPVSARDLLLDEGQTSVYIVSGDDEYEDLSFLLYSLAEDGGDEFLVDVAVVA